MGLIAMDMPSDSYYASGSFSHLINPPAIHLVVHEGEALKQAFSLYKGSGGQVASLLSVTPSGANTQVFTQPANKLATAVNEICMAFGLTKEELAQVCHVQSRKTLYNWINGDAKPRRTAMARIFDLLITARAWLDSGYVVDREQLHEPVLDGHSVFDFLNQQDIDKERILFAGSRLTVTSPPRGNQLEEAGWRQGSIVRPPDLEGLLKSEGIPFEEGLILLVASQSCDIANNNLDSDPFIELSVARRIKGAEGHFTHNKNPRILHTHITCRTGDAEIFDDPALELRAFEKIMIRKGAFLALTPDPDCVLEDKQLHSYVAWLAARYTRPALPTTFNDRVKAADPKDKIRSKVRKGNEQLVGIYVEILPDAEIQDDETYSVNLLGLLPAGFSGDPSKAENAISAYGEVLRKAGMDVTPTIRKEDDVSVAVLKRFKRFYYDDLSLREDAPLPPETTASF